MNFHFLSLADHRHRGGDGQEIAPLESLIKATEMFSIVGSGRALQL